MLYLQVTQTLVCRMSTERKRTTKLQETEGKRARGWITGPGPAPQIDEPPKMEQGTTEGSCASPIKLGCLGTPTCLYVEGEVLGKKCRFLYDTGASCTVISSKWWMELPPQKRPVLEQSHLKLETVGNHQIPVWGKTNLDLCIGGHTVPCEVQIVQIPEQAVLGLDVLASKRCYWDWAQNKLVIPTSEQDEREDLFTKSEDGREAMQDDANLIEISDSTEEELNSSLTVSYEESPTQPPHADMECYQEAAPGLETYTTLWEGGHLCTIESHRLLPTVSEAWKIEHQLEATKDGCWSNI